MPKIRVIDVQTGQSLYECQLKDVDKAYSFAAQMEQLGFDIKVIVPSLSQTLSESLGLSNQDQQNYLDSMEEEIENHDGSCCYEDKEKNKNLN